MFVRHAGDGAWKSNLRAWHFARRLFGRLGWRRAECFCAGQVDHLLERGPLL